jgi:hypothetical protein
VSRRRHEVLTERLAALTGAWGALHGAWSVSRGPVPQPVAARALELLEVALPGTCGQEGAQWPAPVLVEAVERLRAVLAGDPWPMLPADVVEQLLDQLVDVGLELQALTERPYEGGQDGPTVAATRVGQPCAGWVFGRSGHLGKHRQDDPVRWLPRQVFREVAG